jgi:hypothetical protein
MRQCTVCDSPQISAIDEALKAGESIRLVGARFGIAKSNVARHRSACIPRAEIRKTAIEKARELRVSVALQSSADLARELAGIKTVISAYLDAAMASGKSLPLPLVRELRATQELLIKTMFVLESRRTADEPESNPIYRMLKELTAEAAERPSYSDDSPALDRFFEAPALVGIPGEVEEPIAEPAYVEPPADEPQPRQERQAAALPEVVHGKRLSPADWIVREQMARDDEADGI